MVLKKSKKTIFLAKIRDFYKIWTDKVEKNEVLLLWELIHAIFEYFRTVKPNFKISIFEMSADWRPDAGRHFTILTDLYCICNPNNDLPVCSNFVVPLFKKKL